MTIRLIEKEDNPSIAKVIRTILEEYNVPKVGTAYEDKATDMMFETYQKEQAAYWVVCDEAGTVIGGAGIQQLEAGSDKICELQKMYILPQVRGKGVGKALMQKSLEFAKTQGFEQCYLETIPCMTLAIRLYKKFDFRVLDKPIGETGHYSCDMWMIRDL